MITLLKMPALFLGMLAVFCCLGSFFIRENRYESGHLGETVLFGFIAYYFLFELISVPMMVLGAKLHLLAWVWAAVVTVLVIASICLHLGMWREWGKRSGGFWRGKTAAFYVMLVLIGIQLYFVAALQENGSADAAYYVGIPSAALTHIQEKHWIFLTSVMCSACIRQQMQYCAV